MSTDENINKPNKYNNSKIYTIRCRDDTNLIYVGSTTQLLYKRWYEHKKRFNNENNNKEYNKLLYVKMRELGINNFYIELYENINCECKEQLTRKEGEIIRQLGTLNKNVAGRTNKEYYNDNKDKIKEKQKAENNVDRNQPTYPLLKKKTKCFFLKTV